MKHSIDAQFYISRLLINIVALPQGDCEAHTMRVVLEAFGCVVTIHRIGTPMGFLKVLGQGETAPPSLTFTR